VLGDARRKASRLSLRKLIEDIRRRRNLDVYLTVIVALVVSVLSFFDVVPADKVSALVLAVLAILALTVLATREAVENPRLARGDPELLDDFPPDLRSRRESSHSLYLIGVSLSRTLESSYGAFKTNLSRGAHIRVLLTDPEADEAAIDARTLLTRPRTVDMREEIRQSLRLLKQLQDVENGRLEIRTTRAAHKFGLNYVDVDTSASVMYVQLYGYRIEGESRPLLALQRTHGEWFTCYHEQAEAMWREAEPYGQPAGRSS
jgi:hypothetical protein